MKKSPSLHFERFQLDPLNARLMQDNRPLPLTPKAYDVLAFLCQHPGRLVSKEDLLDAVWQRRFVSEGVLKNTIQELRRALGDDPKSPRFIETIHRRGYRFLGIFHSPDMAGEQRDSFEGTHHKIVNESLVVGRDDALRRLHTLLTQCLSGQPQTMFLSGEAGIGKTTLIRQFSSTLPEGIVVIEGQCVEQHGEVEPYLPLLEALNQLGRRFGPTLTEGLRRYAPTWLAQLPWLQSDADQDAVRRTSPGLTKERMQRELCAFLDYWTRDQRHTLVLVLEDLHWSDPATLDAVAYLARYREPTRWLILGSYRPVEVLVNEHPLRRVIGELRLHQRCHDIALNLLPEAAVMEYLTHRFASAPLSNRLLRAINQRTEGLPLYLAHLSNELAAWRELHPRCSEQEMEAFFETLPENLKLFIEQQFTRLPEESQPFLDAAAVGSSGFSPAMLATVTGNDMLAAEAWCENLARDRHILTHAGPPYSPERRSSSRYTFIHAYYQKLAYERVPLQRRANLHLAVAEWFEATCGARVRDLAAEIAMHFEQGRNYERALYYFRIAVQNATGRHEPRIVSTLSRRALEIVEQHLPAVSEYTAIAVELYTELAAAVQITRGWAEPELKLVFDRLLHHEQALDENPHRLRILWAMMGFHFVCGQLQVAEQYAERMLAAGESYKDAWICGHVGKTGVGLYTGRLDVALEHAQATQALYRPEQRGMFPLTAVHPIVLGCFLSSQAYWLLGLPERALLYVDQGITVARTDAQPFSLVFMQWGEMICSQMRGEADLTVESCRALISNADEQGFALMSSLAVTHLGWTLTNQGRIDEGVDLMQRGLDAFHATGTHLSGTYLLSQCADAFLRIGSTEKANAMLDEASELMAQTGERHFEAELHRIRGELMQASNPTDAERHFQSAIETAQRQGARSLELRAVMSLARLWLTQSRSAAVRPMLYALYSSFQEGLDTRDLREARLLLEDLSN